MVCQCANSVLLLVTGHLYPGVSGPWTDTRFRLSMKQLQGVAWLVIFIKAGWHSIILHVAAQHNSLQKNICKATLLATVYPFLYILLKGIKTLSETRARWLLSCFKLSVPIRSVIMSSYCLDWSSQRLILEGMTFISCLPNAVMSYAAFFFFPGSS